MSDKLSVLKDYFGHDSFRDGQEQIVDALLDGRDALCIMPTGAGKSMCYQIPALLFDGVTIVVSPHIRNFSECFQMLNTENTKSSMLHPKGC